jgi:hypothetical protein
MAKKKEKKGSIPAVSSQPQGEVAPVAQAPACYGLYWDGHAQEECRKCGLGASCKDKFVQGPLLQALADSAESDDPSVIATNLGVCPDTVLEGISLIQGIMGDAPAPAQPQYQAPAPAPAQPQYQAPAPAQPQYQAPAPAQPQYQAPAPAPAQPQYQAPAPAPAQPQYQAPAPAPAPAQPQYQAPAPVQHHPYRARRGRKPADLVTCPQCGGTGVFNGAVCPSCEGYGDVSQNKLAMGQGGNARSATMAEGTATMSNNTPVMSRNDFTSTVAGGSAPSSSGVVPLPVPRGAVSNAVQPSTANSGGEGQKKPGRPSKTDTGLVGSQVFSIEQIVQLIQLGKIETLSFTLRF